MQQTRHPYYSVCPLPVLTLLLCLPDVERGAMLPARRGPLQRALSVDAKPLVGGGCLAGRRNVPCPMLIKQENVEAHIQPGMTNGFPGPGGMGVCPLRGGAGTSNLPPSTTLPS